MASKNDNYCQLLGLNPFTEGKYTPEAINDKIDKMEVKWANEFRNKQNDTGQRFKYHQLVDEVPEIRRQMSDPSLRKKVFAEGKKELEGKCQKLRLDCVILADGTMIILPGVIDNFVKRLHWEGVDKKTVLKITGINDGSVPKLVSEKVINAYTNLTTVDAHTPTEVLNALITNQDLEIKCDPLTEASSLSQMRSAFDLCEKRVNSVRQELLPDQDSYISVLRSIKLIIDSDKELNDLINYGRCNRNLEPVMDSIEREYTGQQLSRKYIDELMNVYVRNLDLDMCLSILESFCHKKKIAANFSAMDSSMVRCPDCNNLVPGGNNTMFCPFCGRSFRIVCPQCGTSQLSNNINCIKCGFNFKEGESKAQSLSISFKMDMQRGNISKAEKELNQIKATFATFGELASMEAILQKEKNTLNILTKMVNDNYSAKKFYAAKTAGDQLVQKFPFEIQNHPDVKQRYDESSLRVKNADVFCQKASVIEDKKEMLNMYVNAAEECPDHPGARSVLKQHPPQGPVDPMGKIRDGHLIIKYEAPLDSTNITYMIFREKNSLPNVTDETRALAETPNTVYTDKTLEPGVEYFYSVYSKRWGVLSREAAHFGPVIILAEVEKVNIEQIDGGLRIMYEKPRGATRVRVWRAEENEGTGSSVEIPLNGEIVYDDIGLKGGTKYHYLFVAEYETRNKVERSQGVFYSATPLDAPKPVRDLAIVWNKSDGTFTARWSTSNPVKLFCSEKKYTIQGNMVKMEDIRSWMTEIKPIQEYMDGARFNLPDGTVQYVYPIIPLGTMGIKGNELMVANLKPFRDVEKTIINKDCILTMTWPDNAVAAKLVISTTEIKDFNDPTAEIMTVRRDEYDEDKLIRIPMGKSPKKCINIFATYKVGNESLHSRGIAIDVYSAECKKVRYTVESSRKSSSIEIATDESVDSIPEIVMIRTEEGIPLRKEDGETLWSSNGPINLSGGKCTLNINLKGHQDIEHMRLFFSNEEDYNLFRFIHPLYNRRKD
ncbi:MAG: zinc ribbon domain-containing protein [Candidatus Methanomethylophilaceae archaeon]|nr:zinc ribbon domain-containing protein [Candidatus Methanomethylophilaceae archaeon]